MRIIDAHVHVLSKLMPRWLLEDWGRSDRVLAHEWMKSSEKKVSHGPGGGHFSPRNNENVGLARAHPEPSATSRCGPPPAAAGRADRRARSKFGAVGIQLLQEITGLLARPYPVWKPFGPHLVCDLHVRRPITAFSWSWCAATPIFVS